MRVEQLKRKGYFTPDQLKRIDEYQRKRKMAGLVPDGVFIGIVKDAVEWIAQGNSAHTAFNIGRAGIVRFTLEVLEACEIAGIPVEVINPHPKKSYREEMVSPTRP